MSAAPSSSSLATSCPAPNFFDSSDRQLAKRSIQPSTVYWYSPIAVTPKAACHRSLPERLHRHFPPRVFPRTPVHGHRRQRIVAVGVDVCGDGHRFPHHALDREAPAVDLGEHPLDHDATQ